MIRKNPSKKTEANVPFSEDWSSTFVLVFFSSPGCATNAHSLQLINDNEYNFIIQNNHKTAIGFEAVHKLFIPAVITMIIVVGCYNSDFYHITKGENVNEM